MKSDVIQYERIYLLLKNRIECGILPVGSRLPGRSVLCREFGTSERPIRRALELLEQDGFLEIKPRMRPVVISAFAAPEGRVRQTVRKADAARVNDLLQTSILLCYPIFRQGMNLCSGKDWQTPETLLARMDPGCPEEFWQLSGRLWRFFIARNENELLLRAVDSLGFWGKGPSSDSLEERIHYRDIVSDILGTVKSGGEPGREELKQISFHYKAIVEQAEECQFIQETPLCPLVAENGGQEKPFSLVQERYSTVSLDLLGLIAMGRYQPGDRLPTHDQLQEVYGISRDTSVKAVRLLEEWGVVTAAPRRGISVMMDLESLKRIQITPESIACHVRRYLDSLELLSLTVERIAAHAAAQVPPEAAKQLSATLVRQLEQPYEHQMIPRTLLDFITEHIQYDALKTIYRVVARNFSIGRSIPKLVSRDKFPLNVSIYQQCMEAAAILEEGSADRFAAAAEMFQRVRSLITEECRRLGYWDAAARVYDGTALWK